MPISRSALEVLRRIGLVDEPMRPRPRLNLTDLLVHTIPLDVPKPEANVLINLEGRHPPDHGGTQPWPGELP